MVHAGGACLSMDGPHCGAVLESYHARGSTDPSWSWREQHRQARTLQLMFVLDCNHVHAAATLLAVLSTTACALLLQWVITASFPSERRPWVVEATVRSRAAPGNSACPGLPNVRLSKLGGCQTSTKGNASPAAPRWVKTSTLAQWMWTSGSAAEQDQQPASRSSRCRAK